MHILHLIMKLIIQVDEMAMGSPLRPVLENIFMIELETSVRPN